jgi:hypothetical protein
MFLITFPLQEQPTELFPIKTLVLHLYLLRIGKYVEHPVIVFELTLPFILILYDLITVVEIVKGKVINCLS